MSQAFIADFTAKIAAAAQEAHRGCGLSDVLFTQRFQDACEALLASVLDEHRTQALAIAQEQGYDTDHDADYYDFGPGYCSTTGIDDDCCPCGRHP